MRNLQRVAWVVACVLVVLALGACAGKTAGETIDDAAITAAVKTKLAADPEVAAMDIDVDTTDGVVRLSGTVTSNNERSEAVDLARSTDGVRRVINDLR